MKGGVGKGVRHGISQGLKRVVTPCFKINSRAFHLGAHVRYSEKWPFILERCRNVLLCD